MEYRLYRCANGHEIAWEGDPKGVTVGNVTVRMGFPDECNHLTGHIHAPSLGIVPEVCPTPMELIERKVLG